MPNRKLPKKPKTPSDEGSIIVDFPAQMMEKRLRGLQLSDQAVERINKAYASHIGVMHDSREYQDSIPERADRINELLRLKSTAVKFVEQLNGVCHASSLGMDGILWKSHQIRFERLRHEIGEQFSMLSLTIDALSERIELEPQKSKKVEAKERAEKAIAAAIAAESPRLRRGETTIDIARSLVSEASDDQLSSEDF